MSLRVPAGCEYVSAQTATPETVDAVRQLAWKFGESYASYLVTENDWETFWGPERRGAVRFARWGGRYVYTTGGLLAAEEDRGPLLARFGEFLDLNRLNALFVCIGRDQLAPFRELKYRITKAGEEPLIRLGSATWQGKDFEWLRRQENFCLRNGVKLIEVDPLAGDSHYVQSIIPELEAISREHVAQTPHKRELRYFVGRFTPLEMGHKRLFIAQRDDRIEAFVVCNPCLEGSMWAIEMFRRRADAVRGVIPFAMLQIMRQLQQEGATMCSLSAIPALRATLPIGGDSWVARGGCYLLWNYFNWLYDVRGLYHFKSRFRPESREVYFASWPDTTLLSMIGFTRVWGLSRIDWRALPSLLGWTKSPAARTTLAEPELRPERCVRKLKKDPQPQKEKQVQ